MSTQIAKKPLSAYQVLTQRYFVKCSVLRKHFTGSGKDHSSTIAEAIIADCTVRLENSNSIYMKDSVANLNAVMLELGINLPKAAETTLAEVI